MLAAAELLVRGGERVAVLGLTQPTASRKATTRIAEAILANQAAPRDQRHAATEGASDALFGRLLFSDFLDPIAKTREHVEALAADGAVGHLVADRSIPPRRRCPTRAAPSS